MNAQNSKVSEIFEFQDEIFFTYSGLLRLVHTVINNFVNSRSEVKTEDYAWYDDLPGTISVELHPSLWLGKSDDYSFKNVNRNLEALLYCIETDHKVPEMNDLVENYLSRISSIRETDRCAAYVLSWIYINKVQGLDYSYTDKMKKLLDKYSEIVNTCCIATIVGKNFGMYTGDFDLEEVVSVINGYNKDKYKRKRIKLPNTIENRIYITIALCYKDKDNNSCKCWFKKAYRNAVNDKELQNDILKEIENII